MQTSIIYSDLNSKFGSSGSAPLLLLNEAAVNSHIAAILNTQPETQWWFPTFGSDLQRRLFEPIDQSTADDIYTIVIVAIDYWEPRISLYPDSGVTAYPDQNLYEVLLHYRMDYDSYPWDGYFRGLLYQPI